MRSLTPSQMTHAVKDVLAAGRVPMIVGSPGTAKSAVVKSLAKKADLDYLDFRLTQKEPPDLSGYPTPDLKQGRMRFLPTDEIPLSQFDNVPKGKKGWLLSLEEFNSCDQDVEAAAYALILDRLVGQHPIHPQVYMVGTGNLMSDKAIVKRKGTATQSRLIWLPIRVDNKEWHAWALKNAIDHRVRSFLKFRTDLLHKFDPNHNDYTFPCPQHSGLHI